MLTRKLAFLKQMYLKPLEPLFGKKEKPKDLLSRMLSTQSATYGTTALAEESQQPRDAEEQSLFPQIGKGQCGTIYALKGTTMVIKLPNATQKVDELFRDCQFHALISTTFSSLPDTLSTLYNINVPKMGLWVDPAASHFWQLYNSKFPNTDVITVPNYGLVSERILPVPLPVRSALVDALFPKESKPCKEAFLAKPENRDCLIRLYLGRRSESRPPLDNTHLRNFPLHIDEMEHLGLDTSSYAQTMAQTLAILHWKVGIDANDVEFVLGRAPQIKLDSTISQLQSATKDTASGLWKTDFGGQGVSMWLLDFNQCATFTKDEAGLKKLVDGFWWNDPYYPRPGNAPWEVFCERYLGVSREFEGSGWPEAFIEGVCEVGSKREGGRLFA